MRTYFVKMFIVLPVFWSQVILAHDVTLRRLSDDSSNPLFYAVMVGQPHGAFAAFIIETPESCSLRILGSEDNQKLIELLQHGKCESSMSGDEEDGYSYLNANKYFTFVEGNQDSIKALLKKYQIYHGRSVLNVGPSSYDSAKDNESCVGIGTIRVCAGEHISIHLL